MPTDAGFLSVASSHKADIAVLTGTDCSKVKDRKYEIS